MLKDNTTLQAEVSECGLACLSTVLNHYGHHIGLPELRQRCPEARSGMSLRSLISSAEIFGLDARPVRLDHEEAKRLPTRTILHWNGDHFVVFVSYKFGAFNIIDPSFGHISITQREFQKAFTGFALELQPNGNFAVRRYKKQSIVPRLLRVIPNLYRSLIKLMILSLGLELLALTLPMLTQVIIDEVVTTRDTGLMTTVVVAVAAIAIIQFGASLARGELSIGFKQQSALRLKITVLQHLIELPVDWFTRRHVGDIVSRFAGITTIQNAVTATSMQNILDGIMGIFTGAMVIIYGGWIGAVACLSVLTDLFLKLSLYARYRTTTVSAAALDSQQQTHFLESIRNIASIKMTGVAARRIRAWGNKNVELSNVKTKQQRIELLAVSVQELAAGVDRGIVLFLGGTAVLGGHMTVGSLIALLAFKDQTDHRVSSLTTALFSLRSLSTQSERLRDIVGTPQEIAPAENRKTASTWSISPNPCIIANNLSLRYGASDRYIFRNLSLYIEFGQRVFLRGASGVGKTSLLRTLIGLVEPTEGTIEVGGYSRSPQGLLEYRSQFCGVLQDDALFSGTIAENITCFDPHPDFRKLEYAARGALLLEDILGFTMGMQTYIAASAGTLSGGQRQRLLLARTIYLDAPIVFLDEATSNLDSKSEEEIMRFLVETGKTLIFVSHRESLAKYATEFLSFSGGDITVCKAPRQV